MQFVDTESRKVTKEYSPKGKEEGVAVEVPVAALVGVASTVPTVEVVAGNDACCAALGAELASGAAVFLLRSR